MVVFATPLDLNINNLCNFTSNRYIFVCSGLTATDELIGDFLTKDTRTLILRNNKDVTLLQGHHSNKNYRQLTSYSILENTNLHVEGTAFVGLDTLYYLQIRKNRWPVLSNDTFKGLSNLEVLNIQENNISNIEPLAFSGLRSLTTLELTQNSIKILKSYIFKDLTNLVKLFLEDNNIEIIEENAFYGLDNLDCLDLVENKIKVVDAKEFNIMPKLQYLYLNFNEIESFRGQLDLPELKFLHAQHNMITSFDHDVFAKTPNLQEIDLSFNRLINITEDWFLHLKTLSHVNIFGNGVNATSFEKLRCNTLVTY